MKISPTAFLGGLGLSGGGEALGQFIGWCLPHDRPEVGHGVEQRFDSCAVGVAGWRLSAAGSFVDGVAGAEIFDALFGVGGLHIMFI